MSLPLRYQAASPLSWRDEPEIPELLLFDGRTERYVSLNPVASQIWRRLTSGQSVDAIVDALAASHDAPRERVREDVLAFVQQAWDAALLAPRQEDAA